MNERYPTPKFQELDYTYKKEEQEVWVLNDVDIPVDWELVKDRQMVHLAPGSAGGNHKHPRTEWFIGIGPLEFMWIDREGTTHVSHMNPDGQIQLITVSPHLPHAVVNTSDIERGVLLEFADGKMENVVPVDVYTAEGP